MFPLYSEEGRVEGSRIRRVCWKGQSSREAGGCSGRPEVGVWKLVPCECQAHGGRISEKDKATEQRQCRGALQGDR